jgi:peptidoglycan/LPS O-acetylase OafA/YrhL
MGLHNYFKPLNSEKPNTALKQLVFPVHWSPALIYWSKQFQQPCTPLYVCVKINYMQSSNRQSYLDWLRVLAILGVLFFHSAMPFAAESDWHIKNQDTSHLFLEFNFFLSRFRMPLLFFISGAVSYFMLQNRTPGQFIALRFRRLLIPLVFGMLLIVPIQVYMERVNQGFKGNFLNFYPSIFTTGAYPAGNMSWHHLWFVAYLFVYDVALAPVFKWCIINRPRLSFFDSLGRGKKIYWLILPSLLSFSAMVLRFPETHALVNDWCWFFYWLLFLLAGFICLCTPSLMDSLERNRRTSLSFAVLSIFIINYLRWNQLEPDNVFINWKADPRTYLYLSLYALTAWMWVFSAIGYGKRYLNKKHRALPYLNSAAYPFYILHQTVIVVIAFYVVKTSDTILLKYAFIVLTAFLTSMAIYHLFIRPYALTRFLFGVKLPTEPPHVKEPFLKKEPVIVPASLSIQG